MMDLCRLVASESLFVLCIEIQRLAVVFEEK